MVCLLCDFKFLLTVFNQSYNCQTSHYQSRNRLPNAFLMLPSLFATHSLLSLEVRHLTYFFLDKKPLLASRSKQSILLQFHEYLFSRLMFIFAYNNYLLALIRKPLFFTNIPRHVGLHGMQIYTAVRCGFGTHLLELHSCSC